MKVFFGTTSAKWLTYRKYYFAIRDYLKETGCIITYDWLYDANKSITTDQKRNITKIYKNIINAIDQADIVIIEYTVPNFSSSHQINYALLKKKHTLVMRLKKDNPRYEDTYLEALQSPLLKIVDYVFSDFKTVIDEFIGYSKLEQGQQRYNIVLDKKQKYFLDWASNEYGLSRSNILRNLIDKEIEKEDKYKKYLNIKKG